MGKVYGVILLGQINSFRTITELTEKYSSMKNPVMRESWSNQAL